MNDNNSPESITQSEKASSNNQSHSGDGDNVAGNKIIINQASINPETKPSLNKLSNLNRSGVVNFVGREKQLEELHQLLQENEQVSISAIAGMGGIGKTELALQYAQTYQDEYPGSLCWFSVRGENLVTQIIEFAATYLNIIPPKERESDLDKVKYCWQNWQREPSLIILDDVPNFGQFYQEQITPCLPPVTSKIKVLMTSRERPGKNIPSIDLDVLTEAKALELLQFFIGKSRIEAEPELAKDLCRWLGYLPLGLELVGRYIEIDPSLTLESTLENLKSQQLKAEELLEPEQKDMTAQLGIAAAFELSWQELNSEVQRLGSYLSLFASEPFEWTWVEQAWTGDSNQQVEMNPRDLLKHKRDLLKRYLLKMIPNPESPTEYRYQLHSLIAQYLRAKLEEREKVPELKQKFCGVMNQIASEIPQTPTLEEIKEFTVTIPHLIFVAEELTTYIDNEDLIGSYVGLGRFYEGQGLYNQALVWFEQCLKVCQERLGEQHPSVAISLNNLAVLYNAQGRYESAEPLYLQALELYKQLLGAQHPSVAISLNNLAYLYNAQGRYEEAEPLYLQSLELRKQLLGEQHPAVALSLNNLAALYDDQGKYEEAEPLYLQALELRKQLLGEQHPDVALSLNNLAHLYSAQGKYEEAEPLYLQALELRKQLLGEQHPNVATSLNNLAVLYKAQGRYEAAEPLYLQALERRKQLLGEQHPHVANSLNNLAVLYKAQGRYEEAKTLYLQALAIAESVLGENHPNTKIFRDNYTSCMEKAEDTSDKNS